MIDAVVRAKVIQTMYFCSGHAVSSSTSAWRFVARAGLEIHAQSDRPNGSSKFSKEQSSTDRPKHVADYHARRPWGSDTELTHQDDFYLGHVSQRGLITAHHTISAMAYRRGIKLPHLDRALS